MTTRTADTTDAKKGEYATYAPKGEKCADCHEPFRSLDRVWRKAYDGGSGGAHYGPYVHYDDCPV
ncbi:hypothetical protein [Streptomyces formicae]